METGLGIGTFAPREMTEAEKAASERRRANAEAIETGMMKGICELAARLENGAAEMNTKDITEVLTAMGASAAMLAMVGAMADVTRLV